MSNSKGLSQVFLTRLGLVASGSCAALLAVYACFFAADVELTSRKRERSQVEQRLIAELKTLRATWDPRQRQRILERAPGFGAEFSGPLGRVLRLDDHDLLEQAAEYAGAMGVADIRPALVALACSESSLPPKARMHAVRSAERLEPWTREELAGFLSKGSVPLKLAALQVSGGRADAPWTNILPILVNRQHESLAGLSDEDRKLLRDAAIQAVPKKPDARVLHELWTAVMTGERPVAAAALGALARTEPDPELSTRLLAHLDQLEGGAMIAGLDLLAAWGRPLADARPVWTVVERHDLDVETRALALSCLEQTSSFDPVAVRNIVPSVPPLMQHFAARCLLKTGHADGFRLLLDVTESADARAVVLSRRLLAFLTGKAPATDREGFEDEMSRALASLKGRVLPESGLRGDLLADASEH